MVLFRVELTHKLGATVCLEDVIRLLKAAEFEENPNSHVIVIFRLDQWGRGAVMLVLTQIWHFATAHTFFFLPATIISGGLVG